MVPIEWRHCGTRALCDAGLQPNYRLLSTQTEPRQWIG
jgi:hypothetical protein